MVSNSAVTGHYCIFLRRHLGRPNNEDQLNRIDNGVYIPLVQARNIKDLAHIINDMGFVNQHLVPDRPLDYLFIATIH